MKHIPVLKEKVVELLEVSSNKNFIDCTFGEGGHSLEILKRNGPRGKVLGVEIDKELFERAKKKIKHKRLILVRDSFVNLKKIVKKKKFKRVDGILVDLGICAFHIEESKRGFSFKRSEPLDMRYNLDQEITAEKVLNEYSFKDLERIFSSFGEIKQSKKLVKEILRRRPIFTTEQLVKIIKQSKIRERKLIRKVFLALRIEVNSELENLKKFLSQVKDVLINGGKIAIITYHSLEDRIVKKFFKENITSFKPITKKPITPEIEEIKLNKRARSAKLRVFEKL